MRIIKKIILTTFLLIPMVSRAVTLSDLTHNGYEPFSAIERSNGGFLVFVRKRYEKNTLIYVCRIIAQSSECTLLDSANQN
jgi:hypothetical protein